MSEQLQLRRGSASQIAAFTGAQGEVVVDTTNNRAVVNDGLTPGGWPAAKLAEVVTNARTAVSDAAYAALTTDRLIAYTALTAQRAVTLPAAASYPTGTRLMIVDESGACSSSDTITVARVGADTIDGATSFVIDAAYGGLEIESNGSNAWTILSPKPNLQASLVGVGTAPDPNNALSVYGPSALFNGATSMNITVNKNGAAATASLIFEDAFSGRAQMGLAGSDNFSFKVSANGSSWTTAIAIDAATGAPIFANQRTAVANANYTALTTDRLVAFTALTAARTVTLPAASAYPPGMRLTIVDESGACSAGKTISVNRAGSDLIDGAASFVIAAGYGGLEIESNGSNAWTILSPNPSSQAGSTGTDYSGNKPAIPAVGANFGSSGTYANYVLIATVPANSSRFAIEVENTSGVQIAVVRDDGTAASGAAPANASVFALTGGSAIGAQGGSWTSQTFRGRVQVYAPSSTAQVAVMQD